MGLVHAPPSNVESLVEELQGHAVNTNEFFRKFQARTLSPQRLRVFVRQYHYFCFHFVKVLEGLLYHTPIHEVDMRVELAKTLYSELGSGSPDRVHIRHLERFAFAVGLSRRDLDETIPLPEVTTYLDTLRRFFLHSGYLTALGAELAVETTAVSEFRCLSAGLQRYERFDRQDVAFFDSHVAEEQDHSDWLIEAVRKTIRSERDFHQVVLGARETADAWFEFWAGLYRAVFDANPTDVD